MSSNDEIPKRDQLLKEASKDPHGKIMHIKVMGGEIIQANNFNFTEGLIGRELADWKGALTDLIMTQKIETDNGEVFSLTRYGWESADSIK